MYDFHQQLTTSWAGERKHDFKNYYYLSQVIKVHLFTNMTGLTCIKQSL